MINYINNCLDKIRKEVTSFDKLMNYNPISAYFILAKKMAIDLDRKFNDNITDLKKVYTIDIITGNIISVNKETCPTIYDLPEFRDELTACAIKIILDQIFPNLFSNGKKQKDT